MDANAACRLALALGLDVSGSVDKTEYHLQTHGLANALRRQDVQDVFLSFPNTPISILVFEWAGMGNQRIVLPWVRITDQATLLDAADTIEITQRLEMAPSTAIGEALQFGGALLSQQDCWRKTLDISGDGKSNTGFRPRDIMNKPVLDWVTVNGLVIGADEQGGADHRQAEIAELTAYYQNEVIKGPDAFVEVALGFEDFENAMARKLLRETQTRAVSEIELKNVILK